MHMKLKKTLICTALLSVMTSSFALDVVTDKLPAENTDNSIQKNADKSQSNAVFQDVRHGDGTAKVEIKTVTRKADPDAKKNLSSEQILKLIELDQKIEQMKKANVSEADRKQQIAELVQQKKEIMETGKVQNKIFNDYKEDVDSTVTTLTSLLGIKIDGLDNVDPKTISEEDQKKMVEKIKKMFNSTAPLKVGYLIAIEATPGKMVLVSENGRFIFQGKVYDTYNSMKQLTGVEDIKNYALKANLRKLSIDPDTLSSARIGNGEKEAVFFVDAGSSLTHELIDLVNDFPEKDDYTFYFVPIPADNSKSKELALKFYCAREEGNPQIGNLLYSGKLDKLSTNKCKMDNYDKTMTAAYYAGVDGLPFLIDYDGSISRGIPMQGLYQWLTEHRNTNIDKNFLPKELKGEIDSQIGKRAALQEAQRTVSEHTKDFKADKVYDETPVENEANPSTKSVHEEEEEETPSLDSYAELSIDDPLTQGDKEQPTEAEEVAAIKSAVDADDIKVTEKEKKDYTSEQIAHEPFNYKSKSGDLNGFDMSDEISRYLNEANKTEDEALVVEGVDQSTNADVTNKTQEKEKALSDYEEMDAQAISTKRKGKNKHLVNEVEQLQIQIDQIQNEYNYRRQYLKNQYDREYRNLEVVYGIAQNYNNERRIMKQTDVRRRQKKLFEDYKEKIQKLKDKENAELKAVVDDINYLKGAMDQ